MIQAVEYLRVPGAPSPYEDWVRRGSPEETCIFYATHTNETSDEFLLIPHLDLFYAYVDMDWATVEAAVKFTVDRDKRTVALTGAICRTCNIWPEMMKHLGIPDGAAWGGLDCFRGVDAPTDMGDTLRRLLGPGWKHVYPTSGIEEDEADPALPMDVMEVARAYCEGAKTPQGQPVRWHTVLGLYDTTRAEAATKIQAAFRGWRVRLGLRFCPHNRLGRHVIMRMMMTT